MSERRWRVGRMALAMTAVVTVSACASIPTSGSIEEGEQVRASVQDPLIQVLPRAPESGLTKQQVVSGFLSASASFDEDHGVAREFLTPAASAEWDPNADVVIYDDAVGLSFRGEGADVTISTRQAGRIGPDGAFSARGGNLVVRRFALKKVDGEWRINRLADGLLLTQLDVARSFRSYALQFLAPGQDRLVPDPVYVPIDRSGVSTSLTRALLDGPTRWLEPAVETAIPGGTQLVVDAVPVENGVAQVDLTSEALDSAEIDRERMVAQLVWTLTQLSDVTGVRVTVEGSPLPLPETPAVQTPQTWAAFDPDGLPDSGALLTVRNGAVFRVDGETATALTGPLGVPEAEARFPASSADGSLVAALTEDGRTAVLSDRFATDELQVVREGGPMVPPSMDAAGDLWLAERAGNAPRIWYQPVDGRVQRVDAPQLVGQRIVRLSVALDGTRVAVVTAPGPKTSSQEPALLLCRVVRVGDRVEIQAPRPLAATVEKVSDVSWASSQTLVILGQAQGSVRQPYQVELDGTATEVGGAALQGIVGLTTAPGFPLVAATPDGQLWQNFGVKWRAWLRGSDPAYPG